MNKVKKLGKCSSCGKQSHNKRTCPWNSAVRRDRKRAGNTANDSTDVTKVAPMDSGDIKYMMYIADKHICLAAYRILVHMVGEKIYNEPDMIRILDALAVQLPKYTVSESQLVDNTALLNRRVLTLLRQLHSEGIVQQALHGGARNISYWFIVSPSDFANALREKYNKKREILRHRKALLTDIKFVCNNPDCQLFQRKLYDMHEFQQLIYRAKGFACCPYCQHELNPVSTNTDDTENELDAVRRLNDTWSPVMLQIEYLKDRLEQLSMYEREYLTMYEREDLTSIPAKELSVELVEDYDNTPESEELTREIERQRKHMRASKNDLH